MPSKKRKPLPELGKSDTTGEAGGLMSSAVSKTAY
jgi:hypothetical protein